MIDNYDELIAKITKAAESRADVDEKPRGELTKQKHTPAVLESCNCKKG